MQRSSSSQSQAELLVYKTSLDDPVEEHKQFCIDDELSAVSEMAYDETYAFLNSLEIDTDVSVPLYRMLKWQLLYPPRNDIALVYLLPLLERLETRVRESDVDILVCRDLPEHYRPVVRDVADATGATIDAPWVADQSANRSTLTILIAFGVTLGLFIDQIISLFFAPFLRPAKDVKTLFVPSVSRYESTEPVIKATETSKITLVPILTVTWYWGRFRGQLNDLTAASEFVPVNLYVTPRTIVQGLLTYVQLLLEVRSSSSVTHKLAESISDDRDISCHHTVSYSIAELYTPHLLINILMAYSFAAAIERSSCNSVVSSVGSGSAAQAIWYAGEQTGIDCYYLPHSISLAWRKSAPPSVEKFVPGSLAVEDANKRPQLDSTENLIPLGRPYLSEVYSKRSEFSVENHSVTDPIKILVATEPLEDDIRTAFVERVLNALEYATFEYNICIKIHPDEDAEFYESLRSISDADFSIESASLYERLAEADLVVTMASNVGLEAIILNTASVCVTEWRPFVRPLPYARHGPVPILASEADCREFFSSTDSSSLQHLVDRQWAFISANYRLESDTGKEIAEYMTDDTQ